MRARALPAALLFLGTLSLSTALLIQPVIRRIETQVMQTSEIIAGLFSYLLIPSLSQREIGLTLQKVLKRVDFPMVVTDEFGTPRAWRGIGVDPRRFLPEELEDPVALAQDPDYRRVLRTLEALGKARAPIPIERNGQVVGYIYYGPPAIVRYLRALPLLLFLLGLGAFLGLTWAARSVVRYQSWAMWTHFAKGLAHQMGTPVSSLLGWVEVLERSGASSEALEAMRADLERLRSILNRFSRIGTRPRLTPLNLAEVVTRTVEEARSRFIGDRVDLQVKIEENSTVLGEAELLSWAIENLIKNAYEARKGPTPRIEVRVRCRDQWAEVEVADNGRGIPRPLRKKIWQSNVSTKQRGWGIGLFLVRRIVEEIHRGRVELVKSEPGKETVFRIRLRRFSSGRIR